MWVKPPGELWKTVVISEQNLTWPVYFNIENSQPKVIDVDCPNMYDYFLIR